MNYSFIMLKPDALEGQLVETIMEYFSNANIEIERLGYKIVSEEILSKHYAEVIAKYGADFKRKLMNYFYQKAVIPMIVRGESTDLIADIRKIVGATEPIKADKGTIRGDLSNDSFEKCAAEDRSCENLIHASDSVENAKHEIEIWFGTEIANRYFH
ncbi:MAG: nucleoside-diphosphate kinase [Massiliimalia sp.]|jgi:nucleoside-diphosphate kinase